MDKRVLEKSLFLFVIALVLITANLGCSSKASELHLENAGAQNRINVSVSILPQKYFVERIGGDRVQANVMVPLGFDPHSYEPKPRQVRSLAESRGYIKIGVPFEEAWMGRIRSANAKMLIFDCSEGIELFPDDDPHIWLSPRLVKIMAGNILEVLCSLDPGYVKFYTENFRAFTDDIDVVDSLLKQTISGIDNKKFMVFHPSWAYFSRDYGLEMIAVEVEGKEPSPRELARVIKSCQQNDIKVIFAQPQISAKSAGTIAKEIGGKVVMIDPLAEDWLENMRQIAHVLSESLN